MDSLLRGRATYLSICSLILSLVSQCRKVVAILLLLHHSWFSKEAKMVINDGIIHLIYLFVKQLFCFVVCLCVQTKQISHNSLQIVLL